MDLQVWVNCEHHANLCGVSHNDGIGVDSHKSQSDSNNENKATDFHDFKNADSPNYDSMAIPLPFYRLCDAKPKHSITKSNIEYFAKSQGDSAESTNDFNILKILLAMTALVWIATRLRLSQ